eukprot:CAMPEP_0198277726 /NCGR_PEP_ID=MMETSP1447-20131203/66000_1 /TAXON_ID=420782 /ORGANISM="Chaetoceros dichaeta, Strain CCMP1751" /LENGTH=1037 /DNA_ID=CAMNT_0043972769 /DNA_START=143 /DNA_END=3256 /DNA_ORIENTATION=+
MINPDGISMENGQIVNEAAPDPNAALRFEDLTIDDELSLLDRVVRYVRSGIALQRLVHVKMIAETAKTVGSELTVNTLIPLLPPLVVDTESIIRQHLATQILPVSLICMFGHDPDFNPKEETHRSKYKHKHNTNIKYEERGYKIVTSIILNHINTLITDADMDVRKAASDALATLALYIKPEDVSSMILPIPLRMAIDTKPSSTNKDNNSKEKDKDDKNNAKNSNSKPLNSKTKTGPADELRITASNLLADLASVDSSQITPAMVAKFITPTILNLCKNPAFRVRRAAVQAIPRVVHGTLVDDVHRHLLPCFESLAEDGMYRVRKSVGECLVDMSRSLMLLPYCPDANVAAFGGGGGGRKDKGSQRKDTWKDKGSQRKDTFDFSKMDQEKLKTVLMGMRRDTLVPICARLLGDTNRLVRQGMMQFLGPFIASFYPLEGADGGPEDDGIIDLLRGRENENMEGGMGVQFFPHANGMVNRLNPSNLTSLSADSPSIPPQPTLDSTEYLRSHLPAFLEKNLNDAKSLRRILIHRDKHPVSVLDITTVQRVLLPQYVDLATINTGDDTVDSEMRVYCAYSLPAVLLLLGKVGWDTSLKNCFLALITGWDGRKDEMGEPFGVSQVPLPVKRCLASSFHSVCHMLGTQGIRSNSEDKTNRRDLFTIFETHFLKDTDDTVRLNVIRNLISFLTLLSNAKRVRYLPILYEVITGDSMLASKRTNAMNPMVLNWRQRDMVAQILPNLISLYKPSLVRQYLWPIVKILLCDSVNVVRENTEWSLPVLFRIYEVTNCQAEMNNSTNRDDTAGAGGGAGGVSASITAEASKFSADACEEVIMYLQAILLDGKSPVKGNGKSSSSGAFSNRQGFCRVLSAVALALRLKGKELKRRRAGRHNSGIDATHPFQNFNQEEYKHVHHMMTTRLLPLATIMKDDKVANVRLALAKCLRVMPPDIRDNGEIKKILWTLEDEIDTWGGGSSLFLDGGNSPTARDRTNAAAAVAAAAVVAAAKACGGSGDSDSKRSRDREQKKPLQQRDDDSKSLASI